MRRFFVICLILLLSPKMFAVAMAVPAVQIADAQQRAFSQEGPTASHLSLDCATACDIDPDEPPAGSDVHDSVNQEAYLPFAIFPDLVVSLVTAPRPDRSSVPLFRPPRA